MTVGEASLLPFDEGLAVEQVAFVDLLQSEQAKALPALFFAEMYCSKDPGLDAKRALPVKQVDVVGGRVQARRAAPRCHSATKDAATPLNMLSSNVVVV